MKCRAYLVLRTGMFVALIGAVVLYYVRDGWSAALGFFGCCVPLWFGFSLFVDSLVPVDPGTYRLRTASFAMVDAYVIVSLFMNMTPGPAAGSVLNVIVLGVYLMSAAWIAGPVVGGAAGLAGVLGVLSTGPTTRQILVVLTTAVAAVGSGLAWRACMPVLWRAVSGPGSAGDGRVPTDGPPVDSDDLRVKLDAMQDLLNRVSEERDEAQEQAAELQERLSAAAVAGAGLRGDGAGVPAAGDAAGDGGDEWESFEQKTESLNDAGARKVLNAKVRQLMESRREMRRVLGARELEVAGLRLELEEARRNAGPANGGLNGAAAAGPASADAEADEEIARAFAAVAAAGQEEDGADAG